jgi:hypothetical protein
VCVCVCVCECHCSIENEFLNNCDNFRAINLSPVPTATPNASPHPEASPVNVSAPSVSGNSTTPATTTDSFKTVQSWSNLPQLTHAEAQAIDNSIEFDENKRFRVNPRELCDMPPALTADEVYSDEHKDEIHCVFPTSLSLTIPPEEASPKPLLPPLSLGQSDFLGPNPCVPLTVSEVMQRD